MKQIGYRLALVSAIVLLSGCATLSPKAAPPDALHQQLGPEAAQKLDNALNTTADGSTTSWTSSDGDTQYQLTLNRTFVNPQGQPCRHYLLNVHQDYHRTLFTHAVECRDDDGQWRLGVLDSNSSK